MRWFKERRSAGATIWALMGPLAAGLCAAAGFATGLGCGDGAGEGGAGGAATSSPASSTTTSSTTASTSTGSGGGFVTDCDLTPAPRPSSVPDSWEPYTCWPGCTYWIAPPSAMPEPITWEPCPDLGQWPRGECLINTLDDGQGTGMGAAPNVDTSIDGSPRIQYARASVSGVPESASYNEWVVSRADGPVEFAVRVARDGSGCKMYGGGLRGRHAAYNLTGPYESIVDGLLLVNFDARRVSSGYPDDDILLTDWTAGEGWVVRHKAGLTAIRPDGSEQRVVHDGSTDPNGLSYDTKAIVVGDEIVYGVGNYSYRGVYGFHPEHGTRALVTYPSDLTQGAGNVGTDGIDLVWSHGHSRPPGEPIYPEMDVYTAPFTTDPATLQPRRLRKDMANDMGTYAKQFAVGCGFAGRGIPNSGQDSQLIRLSDGVAWRLTGGGLLAFRYHRVLGISCEHAYVQVQYDAIGKGSPGQTTIVRVRLDELGEGLPPD